MSRINYEALQQARPDLAATWQKLQHWIDSHPRTTRIDAVQLAKDLRPWAVRSLTEALAELQRQGFVKLVYMVRQPNGTFLPDQYESIGDIPSKLPTRLLDQWLDVSDENISAVYELQQNGPQPRS